VASLLIFKSRGDVWCGHVCVRAREALISLTPRERRIVLGSVLLCVRVCGSRVRRRPSRFPLWASRTQLLQVCVSSDLSPLVRGVNPRWCIYKGAWAGLSLIQSLVILAAALSLSVIQAIAAIPSTSCNDKHQAR
jgi:hypothetical protein